MAAQTLCNGQHKRLAKNWKAINQRVAVQIVVRRISCEVTTIVDMSTMAQNYSLHENDEAQTVPLDIKGLCRLLCNVNKVTKYCSFIGSNL
jgi:hypothetical protein